MTEKLTEREITKETAIQIDGQDDNMNMLAGLGKFSVEIKKNKKLRKVSELQREKI